jgi:hypothetical protein
VPRRRATNSRVSRLRPRNPTTHLRLQPASNPPGQASGFSVAVGAKLKAGLRARPLPGDGWCGPRSRQRGPVPRRNTKVAWLSRFLIVACWFNPKPSALLVLRTFAGRCGRVRKPEARTPSAAIGVQPRAQKRPTGPQAWQGSVVGGRQGQRAPNGTGAILRQ